MEKDLQCKSGEGTNSPVTSRVGNIEPQGCGSMMGLALLSLQNRGRGKTAEGRSAAPEMSCQEPLGALQQRPAHSAQWDISCHP